MVSKDHIVESGATIERLLDQEKWDSARRVIRKELKATPHSHWLLTRLATTYYEQRQYKRALAIDEKTLKIAPQCPLVLWNYAGALSMVGRKNEANRIYTSVIKRGVESIAYGKCGEGIRWARGLINDCRYCIGMNLIEMGNHRKGLEYLREHLAHRTPASESRYPIREVRRSVRELEGKLAGSSM